MKVDFILNLLESLRYVSSVWARKTQTVLDPITLAVSAAQPGRAETGSPAWMSWGGGHNLDELDPKPERTVGIAPVRTTTCIVCVERGMVVPSPWAHIS